MYIIDFDDDELTVSALKNLLYITCRSQVGIDAVSILAVSSVVWGNVVFLCFQSLRVFELLEKENVEIRKEALKLIGNILSGSYDNADTLLNYPIMSSFAKLVEIKELRSVGNSLNITKIRNCSSLLSAVSPTSLLETDPR